MFLILQFLDGFDSNSLHLQHTFVLFLFFFVFFLQYSDLNLQILFLLPSVLLTCLYYLHRQSKSCIWSHQSTSIRPPTSAFPLFVNKVTDKRAVLVHTFVPWFNNFTLWLVVQCALSPSSISVLRSTRCAPDCAISKINGSLSPTA